MTEIIPYQEEKVLPSDQRDTIMSTMNSANPVGNERFTHSDDDHSSLVNFAKNKLNHTKLLSDSESENDFKNIYTDKTRTSRPSSNSSSDSDDYANVNKQRQSKSLGRKIRSDASGSDSGLHQERGNLLNIDKANIQHRKIKKRNKMRDKFQILLNSREKENIKDAISADQCEFSHINQTSSSDDEMTSINNIKQKIKERSNTLKLSICDPDSSEDDGNDTKYVQLPKKQEKRSKLISPKPQRMSAKQAMENMQKIKSESNRMLREKEVSLPYHRPKALSLKDILSRRKPGVSSDGKVLPIKMNEEQLKQYALQLEERQKEMIELCKSDSEEDDDEALVKMQPANDPNTVLIQKVCETVDRVCEPEVSVQCHISTNISNNDINTDVGTEIMKFEKSNVAMHSANNQFEATENKENKTLCEITTDSTSDKSEDISAGMELIYNDSVEKDSEITAATNTKTTDSCTQPLTNLSERNTSEEVHCFDSNTQITNNASDASKDSEINNARTENMIEKDSQLISLRYDTEQTDSETLTDFNDVSHRDPDKKVTATKQADDEQVLNDIDMEGINIDDIDNIIENAELMKDEVPGKKYDSPALVKQETMSLKSKPTLTGAPGMLIDLDGNNATLPKKLTGVELLKERFTFFATLKTPEELEREREKRQKPGTQHIKLKQELEDQIAAQRSLEWTKRLESEKQQQKELNAIKGDASDAEDDIDKLESKLQESEVDSKNSSDSEAEEELVEDDVLIEDKPRNKNPLLELEAEESDADEVQSNVDENEDEVDRDDNNVADEGEYHDSASEEESSDDEESSESEDEKETKPKKGRILKAFEDSDDDGSDSKIVDKDKIASELQSNHKYSESIMPPEKVEFQFNDRESTDSLINDNGKAEEDVNTSTGYEKNTISGNDNISESQDDVLQLAQVSKTNSEEIFASQENVTNNKPGISTSDSNDVDLGSQTFSILNSSNVLKTNLELDLSSQEKTCTISETQLIEANLEMKVGLCEPSLSQNYIEFKPPLTQSQNSQSLPLNDELLDMCTGKFYDNQLVSQTDDNTSCTSLEMTQDFTQGSVESKGKCETEKKDDDILKSVLDELNEPEFECPKPMKFFCDGKGKHESNVENSQIKKKFVIDSDDDVDESTNGSKNKRKKKVKKKKLEQRALQISDDEDDDFSELEEDYISDKGDLQNDEERLVEYDSEENEIEIKQQPKKKRKMAEFFEQEAELTSEDEWVGSGDEDEAGLDRMEREAGDDDTFHQGALQAELGQIHMRDILDQDKREVRLIQELLFEDGDLGGGGRQRKFRWRTADGEDVTGTVPDQFMDTQEEEFESEEQWRKQRHEREMFLKQMKNENASDDIQNISVNRTTIIKANLLSRTMSSVLEEASKKPTANTTENSIVSENKSIKDIPSPKKPFPVFKQNYHGSLLTRGRGALARLAALATPLAVDDDAPKIGLIAPSSKRNFVFASITPEEKEPKVNKRKADADAGTPRLVKKMRKEDKKPPKNSLLDHFKS